MLFNSAEFLVFFACVVPAYFLCPGRWRWALVLAVSLCFYGAWNVYYVPLILTSTIVDYSAGRGIASTTVLRRKRFWLGCSVAVNMGLLMFFKYADFTLGVYNSAAIRLGHPEWTHTLLHILLPVGISFHTFQSLGYTLDVYAGKIAAERHFGRYAAYICYFPQLVAGPIDRLGNLLVQFREEHRFDYGRAVSGLQLMLWGLFKKVVIADRAAALVNVVYGQVSAYEGPALCAATLLFGLQIYCDFSGYTDIARGAARIMGFRLLENFNAPYLATSIPDFWRRWHMSLTSWFRDHVYFRLGGNRVPPARHVLNILIVFLISGLWHGANWTFVAWGLMHGVLMIGSLTLQPVRAHLLRLTRLERAPILLHALRVAITFALVNLAWVFFRAQTIAEGATVFGRMRHGWDLSAGTELSRMLAGAGLTVQDAAVLGVGVVVLAFADWLHNRGGFRNGFGFMPSWVRWPAYYAACYGVFCFGLFGKQQFIYFQF